MKKTFTLLFLLISLSAMAQEKPFEEAITQATVDSDSTHIDFDVKPLPNDATKSIAAVIRHYGEHEEGDILDLVLLLIDNESEKILAKNTEEEKYSSDAIRLDGVKLDMANYTVADGLLAFGVRDSYSGSSHPNPYGSENISLYTIKDNKFNLVLDKFETYSYSGETDMKCYFDGEETNSVLIMQKTKTSGYYDIKVKTTKKIMKSRPVKKDDDCIDSEKKLKPTYTTLKFIGGNYQPKKK